MSGSVTECRPIPGQRWHQATIEGEIRRPERRVRVARYQQKRGGRSYIAKRYVKVLQASVLKVYRGRVRLRQPNGTVRTVRAWKLIAATWICRIVKTDRCEFIDGDPDNCKADNLRIVRASGKRVTLLQTGGAA